MSSDPPHFSIEVAPHAERDLAKLPSTISGLILEEIKTRLAKQPLQEIKTRIKRLAGFAPPLYRLRVGDYRVYYRVIIQRVVILGAFHKKDSDRWLKRQS
jgi:mRNA-degrading endonuclease RelE of RelBE toxin-antitoxin system